MCEREATYRPYGQHYPWRWVGVSLVLFLCWWCPSRFSMGAEVVAKNGMLLEGQIGYLASLVENPFAQDAPAGGVDVKQIVLLDDGLRRTYLSWHQVQELRESDPSRGEQIAIRQNVAVGRKRVGSIASILNVTDFDAWGRRTFSVMTPRGRLDIVQGITLITPLYTKVEGLAGSHAIQWDSRIATSSIPRETLGRLLRSQASADDANGRLQIVRLLFEAERYQEARLELEQAMREFPELRELQDLLTQLRQFSARRLVDEIELRRGAGQHQRARSYLEAFPDQGVATETLVRVSELLKDYETNDRQIAELLALSERLIGEVQNAQWRPVCDQVLNELKSDLSANSLDRLADVMRLADDAAMPSENKLALLISGWVWGAGEVTQNLAEAVSAVRVRDLVALYLRAANAAERQALLTQLGQEEAATPPRIAATLARLVPPVATEPQADRPAGSYRLVTPAKASEGGVEYEVQLPEEYDPYRRYPAIVSLHAAGTTPAAQIDWWAGMHDPSRTMRLGQATRHGYIVIAPQWTRENQTQYEYSGREHAAVLATVRDACRRFSVDTDRLFLSGHSIGGDAAWDIGLSHPDLWAGVLPIAALADYGPQAPKYISQYWGNAKYVPFYFVAGELDGDKMTQNGRDFDRYMTRPGIDVTVVEYQGRGHEHFYDEIHRLFSWMNLHRRQFHQPEFTCESMRTIDNFFWCLEVDQLPERSLVGPLEWPAPSGTRPTSTEFRTYANGQLGVKTGAAQATLWLSPDWIDLNSRVMIAVNGRSRSYELPVSIETMLEDARTRVDRLHVFWTRLELETGRRT